MPLPLDLKENRLEVCTTSRGRKRVPFQATITDRGRLELSSRFNGFKNKYSKKSSPNKFLEFFTMTLNSPDYISVLPIDKKMDLQHLLVNQKPNLVLP